MVPEDRGLVAAECFGYSVALVGVEDYAGILVKESVIVIERTGILGQWVEEPA